MSWCTSVDQPCEGSCCLHIWSTRVECGQYMYGEGGRPMQCISSASSCSVFIVSLPRFTCMAYCNMLQAAKWKLKVINPFAIGVDKVAVPTQKEVTEWQSQTFCHWGKYIEVLWWPTWKFKHHQNCCEKNANSIWQQLHLWKCFLIHELHKKNK